MASNKTVIVTGASQGIGAAVVQAFLGRGYNVVATSRSFQGRLCRPRTGHRSRSCDSSGAAETRDRRASHRRGSARCAGR